jgi:hypothetical protein
MYVVLDGLIIYNIVLTTQQNGTYEDNVIIQYQREHGATIMELFSALAHWVFVCPDHTFGHYVNIQNCFIQALETRFLHYP